MKANLRNPCNDCPFRRSSAPGWLGAAPPEWFIESALADQASYGPNGANAAPCHQTVDYESADWLDNLDSTEVCVGALQFAANCGKLPRDPERAEMVRRAGRNEFVFAHAEEFVQHHRNAVHRSWEDAEDDVA